MGEIVSSIPEWADKSTRTQKELALSGIDRFDSRDLTHTHTIFGEMTRKFFDVTQVRPELAYLYLIVDGAYYRILWQKCSPRLAAAQPHERAVIEVAPSGYGLHWPLVDEDLALRPLLSIAEWMIVEGVAG